METPEPSPMTPQVPESLNIIILQPAAPPDQSNDNQMNNPNRCPNPPNSVTKHERCDSKEVRENIEHGNEVKSATAPIEEILKNQDMEGTSLNSSTTANTKCASLPNQYPDDSQEFRGIQPMHHENNPKMASTNEDGDQTVDNIVRKWKAGFINRFSLTMIKNNSIKTKNKQTSTEFPKAGVKLSFIVNEFINNDCGGKHKLNGLSTEQVCKNFIKPNSQHLQSSYCEMLKQKNHPAYDDKAQVFISHAHGFEFLAVIDALVWHFRDCPDIVIWFDLFSINQHQPMDWTFEWLSTTFKSSIEQFGRTVMVLSPWNNPLPFTRAWCIFEVYCTASANNKFEIALGENDRTQFLKDVQEDPSTSIDKLLGTIDAEKSECSQPEDRERIFSVIKETVGFAKINSMVFEEYRDWVVKVALEGLEMCQTDEERCRMLKVVGVLYLGQGKHQEAETYLKQCYELSRATFGISHEDTLESIKNYANVYLDRGDYGKAQSLLTDCLERCIRHLGPHHRITLESMSYMGILYQIQGEYKKALSLYEECLKGRRVTLGENHHDTLASMNRLASLYDDQGEYDKAEKLYVQSLEKQQSSLGDTHPGTLTSMNNLALFYKERELYEKSLPLYVECLERRRTALGPIHPETLNTMNNLACFYYSQGRYDEALPLYEECLDKQSAVLGENHPNTLTSLNNLGTLYNNQGQFEKARIFYRDCFVKRTATLGPRNPVTLNSMNNLAYFYAQQGQLDKALPLYEECLSTRQDMFGSDHPLTLDSISNLASLLEKKGDLDRCCMLYEECLEKRRAVCGVSARDTLSVMCSLALLYDKLGETSKAKNMAEDCVKSMELEFGEDHPWTLAAKALLKNILNEIGSNPLRESFEKMKWW